MYPYYHNTKDKINCNIIVIEWFWTLIRILLSLSSNVCAILSCCQFVNDERWILDSWTAILDDNKYFKFMQKGGFQYI